MATFTCDRAEVVPAGETRDTAAAFKAASTCAGDDVGEEPKNPAAAPATCGAAIEVPLNTAVPEPILREVMEEPGAKMSTIGPWLEKYER